MHFTYAAKGRGLFITINPAPRRPASTPAVSGRPGERGGVTSPGRTRTRARAALRGGSAGKRDAAGLLLLLGVSVSQRHLPRPRRRISEAPRTTKSVPVSGHRGRRVQRSRNQRSAPGRVGRRSPGAAAVPSPPAWQAAGTSSQETAPLACHRESVGGIRPTGPLRFPFRHDSSPRGKSLSIPVCARASPQRPSP